MSNYGKRSLLPEREERVAKKTRCFHHTENSFPDGAVSDDSSDQPSAGTTSYIDLTQDEPTDGALPIDTLTTLPTICLDLVDGQDETLPGKVTITADSGAMKSDAATRGLEPSGSAARTTVTPTAIRSWDATSVAAYDVCFGLVIY